MAPRIPRHGSSPQPRRGWTWVAAGNAPGNVAPHPPSPLPACGERGAEGGVWGLGPGVAPPATHFAPLRGARIRARSTITISLESPYDGVYCRVSWARAQKANVGPENERNSHTGDGASWRS